MTAASIGRDRRGVAALEFALVAPVLLVLVMGLCELGYQAYAQAVVTGAVQKAGRDNSVQGASNSMIDNAVLAQIQAAVPHAAFTSGYPIRRNYAQFGDIAPEPFVDLNGNSVHDAGECFTDMNGNGTWDADAGSGGQGGANDVAVYTVSIVYPHLMPISRWMGWGSDLMLTASTILKNQPYASQAGRTYAAICA
jgi:Flp pilus assembly protein TadG